MFVYNRLSNWLFNRLNNWLYSVNGVSPCTAAKGQIPLRYLVANRSEAGRRPAASRNLACHLARAAGLRPASNLSATR